MRVGDCASLPVPPWQSSESPGVPPGLFSSGIKASLYEPVTTRKFEKEQRPLGLRIETTWKSMRPEKWQLVRGLLWWQTSRHS